MAAERVTVVTDSTAALPRDLVEEAGLTVVPLSVVLDGAPPQLDGAVDGALAEALRRGGRMTTSQPAPEEFARVYSALAADGAEAIVSVHISGELSGTARSAAEAARTCPVPVRVVDSRTVALGTGFAAVEAARAAADGGSADDVERVAREVADASAVLFAVQDLGYLARGGRIGAAKALVGSVLGVRPVLRVADGRIGVAETVRGAGRASRRLVELGLAAARDLAPRPLRVAVHHFDADDAARRIADQLTAGLTGEGLAHRPVLVAEVTAVVGVHTGPGVLGVVVAGSLHTDG
jgi:DegV family protein with EDD domain